MILTLANILLFYHRPKSPQNIRTCTSECSRFLLILIFTANRTFRGIVLDSWAFRIKLKLRLPWEVWRLKGRTWRLGWWIDPWGNVKNHKLGSADWSGMNRFLKTTTVPIWLVFTWVPFPKAVYWELAKRKNFIQLVVKISSQMRLCWSA